MSTTTRHLLDETEAGRLLGMLSKRVKRLARQGIIPHVVLPDQEIRFDADDLWQWVEQFKRPAEGSPTPKADQAAQGNNPGNPAPSDPGGTSGRDASAAAPRIDPQSSEAPR
jgi:hypothetical protein